MKRSILPLLALLANAGCDSSNSGPIPDKPSLVIILTDDLDWASLPYFPRLQTLADEGVTFDNFFVSNSVCAPSRASFLRGEYSHNHGVLGNHGILAGHYAIGGYALFRSLHRESSTLATWLQAAGYRTAFVGRYMNEYPELAGANGYVPPGWSEWYASLSHYYDFQLNENGEIVDYIGDVYETDVLAAKAADFVRRAASANEPFFLYLAPYAPHEPSLSASRHAAEFAGVTAPRGSSFNEEDVSDKPISIASRPLLSAERIDELDDMFRRRLRTMRAVEELLDTLFAAMSGSGVLDSTYVFFTSDNGFHYGEHRLRWGKALAYEEDIRVPLIVRGPGLNSGRVVSDLVLNHDIAPTLAQLAGVTAPPFVDGQSLVPTLFAHGIGSMNWTRRGFLVQARRERADVAPSDYFWQGYRALRTTDYLYVEWETGEHELYDLEVDPYQLDNIYASADPELIVELAAWLDRVGSCSGQGCATAEAGR